MSQLTRSVKVHLFALGSLDKLKKAGLIDGPDVLTDEGRIELEKLHKEGFRPTDLELREAVEGIIQTGFSKL